MDMFMKNPGLCHIGKKILNNLDFKTQLDCGLVQKSWRHIIDEKASKIDVNALKIFFKQSVTTATVEELMKMKGLRHSNKMIVSRKVPVIYEESYKFWHQLFGSANSLPNNIKINIYLMTVLKRMIKTQEILKSPLREFFERRNFKMVEVILNQGMINRFRFQDMIRDAVGEGCIEMIKIMHPLFDIDLFLQSIRLSIYNGK